MLSHQLSSVTSSSVNSMYHVAHYIPSTYNWKFVPFDCLHPVPPSSPPTSSSHISDLFLNWSTVDGTVLCQFQVYNLVIQHLNTLRNDPHKSSNHLAAYKVITVLLTIFLMLYITFLWYFFYNWKFVPLNPIHLYHPSLHPSAFWQLPVCSLDLSQFLFCFACWSTIQ